MTRSRRAASYAKAEPRTETEARRLLVAFVDELGEIALRRSKDETSPDPLSPRATSAHARQHRDVKRSIPRSIEFSGRRNLAPDGAIATARHLRIVLALCALAVVLIAAFGVGAD
jgi:hypothetical protein